MPTPRFFRSAGEFRKWLEAHHDSASELVVGFHRVNTGQPSMTWAESVREALCFGWIDGLVKRIDDTRYSRRFTPRKPGSIWSAVNVKHAQELIASGRMQAAGLAAFGAREASRSGIYSFEQNTVELPEPYASLLRSSASASAHWDRQPASYKKAAAWWVISAKQDATRNRRVQSLIEYSAQGERLPQFVSTKASSATSSRGSSK
jgi:uncharacterized protein YdeI (YjbR/CyaY-like superfamily)